MAETDSRVLPASRTGRQLYELLPAIYRSGDNTENGQLGDLGRYLDAMGGLLDEIRATLDQRLADNFPDNPEQGLACQPWLLPYFAQLLDVHLVSPEIRGQREEVSQAVGWRQRKGTTTVAEEIAEAVAQMEVESQEGWRRLAVTPRIGMPLLPAWSFGEDETYPRHNPSRAAQHPGLPAATVDFRQSSRAIQTDKDNPAVQHSNFPTGNFDWRYANLHGVPCFPGSYQDVSRRTADMRDCDWKQGHFHPKRLLLHVAPPMGFFPLAWAQQDEVLRGNVTLSEEGEHAYDGWIIEGRLEVTSGRVRLRRCAIKELFIDITAAEEDVVLLDAVDCLFETVTVNQGTAELEYCTVLADAQFFIVNASECIFAGSLASGESATDPQSCIRYSRLPKEFPASKIRMRSESVTTNTREQPVFYHIEYCSPWDDPEDASTVVQRIKRRAQFGDPSCGVLHPATPDSILYGAEDGGEMGAYHFNYYALRYNAVTDKVRDFLPVGMQVALIPDSTLYNLPPQVSENNSMEENP